MIENNKLVLFLLSLIIIEACFNQKQSNNLNIVEKKIFEYQLSEKDTTDVFGIPLDSHFEIGPTSPIIVGEDIYLLDVYFNKVKKITKNGKLKSSKILANNREIQWLIDLIYNKKNIYVLTDFNDIYVLDTSLFLINHLVIPNYNSKGLIYNKYFISKEKPVFYDIRSGFVYLINKNSIDSIGFKTEIDQPSHIQKYELDSTRTVITTPYGILKLDEPIQNITLDFYQCRNVAFSESMLVHFSISPDRKKITFYRYRY